VTGINTKKATKASERQQRGADKDTKEQIATKEQKRHRKDTSFLDVSNKTKQQLLFFHIFPSERGDGEEVEKKRRVD